MRIPLSMNPLVDAFVAGIPVGDEEDFYAAAANIRDDSVGYKLSALMREYSAEAINPGYLAGKFGAVIEDAVMCAVVERWPTREGFLLHLKAIREVEERHVETPEEPSEVFRPPESGKN